MAAIWKGQRQLLFASAKYLGGYDDHAKAIDGPLVFDADGIHQKKFRDQFVIPWGDVEGIAVEDPGEASKRVTATRLLTLGVFALAAKKKTKVAYLTVTTPNGDVFFEIDKKSPQEARGLIASHVTIDSPPADAASPAAPDVADQLTKLAALRKEGVLSDEEFDAQKARLLG